jgi:tetratricopeptide (TPR) repeat protein
VLKLRNTNQTVHLIAKNIRYLAALFQAFYMTNRIFSISVCLLFFCACSDKAFAQPSWTIDLLGKEKKPEKFVERKLGSEKMAEKKFTKFRHVVQNNFTHYNYYYNANNKIKAVIERAKASQQDDFSKLIGYYPFTLQNTLSQKNELDSVIFKATAGILLHDLRNDWIDDMYLLMGKAYFFRKDFDSAAATFQFINYNLFPRKKNEDDSRVIGTNDDANKSRISIANPEKQNILQKLTAKPPSRNDALVWLARTLIEQDELGESAGIVHTLQNDPNLPERLANDLDEVAGYLFYKQNMYDSAAAYLEKALSNADTKQDRSRSEFLLGQLYEMTNRLDKAGEYYNKASLHTTDPLIDIYAQMNYAKMRKGNKMEELETGISNLLRLTKKDKFEMYKDVLFYAAGELALEKPDTAQAIDFYTKSFQRNESNIPYKNKAFLKLADIAYNRKEYKKSFIFYDSLQSGDTTLQNMETIQARRNSLSKIVDQLSIIEREDSLQRVAAMDPAKREAFVKKLARRLRKERGLKEEENNGGSTDLITFDSKKEAVTDLFQASNKTTGEWYFYNASLKSKGFSEFKRKWGTRTNTDNWRRKDAMGGALQQQDQNNAPQLSMNPDDTNPDSAVTNDPSYPASKALARGQGHQPGEKEADQQPADISFEALMDNLPLTPEELNASKNLVASSTYQLGRLFQDELEDYQEAINTYDLSLEKYPDSTCNGEIYFNLYYCYYKLGNKQKATFYKNLLEKNFSDTKASKLLSHPLDTKSSEKNPEVTKRYEDIYNLFIEGKFDEAIAEKKKADSLYGNNYWSPQLLYIEAVYNVKQKNDTAAIEVLNNIILLYPKSPLKQKAERMIDVLGRRKEIEEYLTKLDITRANEDDVVVTNNRVAMVRNDSNLIVSPKLFDSSKAVTKITDSAFSKTESVIKAPVISGPYTFNTAAPHNVIMWLDKVDVTYVNESKNAFIRYVSDNFRVSGLTVNKDVIDKDYSLLVFASFANAEEAMLFYTKIKRAAPEEISWLPASKYAFYIIDNDNLERLKNTKDLTGYKNLLNRQYPGFFK